MLIAGTGRLLAPMGEALWASPGHSACSQQPGAGQARDAGPVHLVEVLRGFRVEGEGAEHDEFRRRPQGLGFGRRPFHLPLLQRRVLGAEADDDALACLGERYAGMSYDTDENGPFLPEYVNVLGAPLSISETGEGGDPCELPQDHSGARSPVFRSADRIGA